MTVLKRFILIDNNNDMGVSYEPYATDTVPGVIKTDGSTLTSDENDQFSVSGMKTKDGRFVYDWIGTLAEYQAAKTAGTIQSTWMCFITDDAGGGGGGGSSTPGGATTAPFSINSGSVTNGKNTTLTASGATLSCAACVVSNTIGNQTSIAATNLNVASYANGAYHVFVDVSTKTLTLYSNFTNAQVAPTNPATNYVWLDTSVSPAVLKVYNGALWAENNNLVRIGTVTVNSGSVSTYTNLDFNSPGYSVYVDSPYQDIVTLTDGTVALQKDRVLYYRNVSANTTFTFSNTNISLDNTRAYTFELLLYQGSAYSLTFPSTVRWQDSTTPTMTASGYYFFAFRTIDGGSTWKGSLQGVWE